MSNHHTLEFNKKKFIEEELVDGLFWIQMSSMSGSAFLSDHYQFNENPDPCDKECTYNTSNITEAEPIFYVEKGIKYNDFENCMERINRCEVKEVYIRYDVTFEIDSIKAILKVYNRYYRTTVNGVNEMRNDFTTYYKSIHMDYDMF